MNPDGRHGHALLMSGGLGMGHAVTAMTCAASLEARGWSTRTLDAMRLLGGRGGTAGEAVFRGMLAMPGLYDAFHFAALRPGNRLALRIDAAARRRLVPKLREYLDARPADLVISVFSTGASAMSALAGQYPGMKHVVFCTDVTPHRLWVHPGVDLYLVTSHAAECAVRRFQPGARVLVMPPPVRPGFYTPPPQCEARSRFGIPRDARCVLLMSGGWGLGPVAGAATALADAGLYVLAVAGRNATLESSLRSLQQRQPRVRAFGYTDRVPELMAAADLVITSSGDTCTEARTVGRNLLLLDVVPGHGRDNLQHELELGNASVTSPSGEAIVANTLAALGKVAEQGMPHRAAPDGTVPDGAASGGAVPDEAMPDGKAAGLGTAHGAERWEAAFSAALAAAGIDGHLAAGTGGQATTAGTGGQAMLSDLVSSGPDGQQRSTRPSGGTTRHPSG